MTIENNIRSKRTNIPPRIKNLPSNLASLSACFEGHIKLRFFSFFITFFLFKLIEDLIHKGTNNPNHKEQVQHTEHASHQTGKGSRGGVYKDYYTLFDNSLDFKTSSTIQIKNLDACHINNIGVSKEADKTINDFVCNYKNSKPCRDAVKDIYKYLCELIATTTILPQKANITIDAVVDQTHIELMNKYVEAKNKKVSLEMMDEYINTLIANLQENKVKDQKEYKDQPELALVRDIYIDSIKNEADHFKKLSDDQILDYNGNANYLKFKELSEKELTESLSASEAKELQNIKLEVQNIRNKYRNIYFKGKEQYTKTVKTRIVKEIIATCRCLNIKYGPTIDLNPDDYLGREFETKAIKVSLI